ncbi:MAG TPA: YchJ family metal-binding protein [Polyangia bacterium]|jgi:SEC-C motif-containing protein
MGLGAYLVDTLAAAHPDRTRERAVLERELATTHLTQRFTGLRILASANGGPRGDEGEVLFHARIFSRGRDQSFLELSRFVREAGAWRYLDGVLGSPALFDEEELASLGPTTFLERVAANRH